MAKYTDAIRDAIIVAFQAGDQPTEAQFTNWITRIQEGIEEHDHDGTGDGDGIAAIGITGITGVGVDVPVNWYLGRGAALERLVFDDNGLSIMGAQLGIGTLAQVVGVANMIAWEGPDVSMAGPHLQISTDADAFPVYSMINWSHDNIEIYFDAYLDAIGYKSSDAGSSFGFVKAGDTFAIKYGVAAAGAAIVFSDGLYLNTVGTITIPDLAGIGVRAVVADAAGNLSAP